MDRLAVWGEQEIAAAANRHHEPMPRHCAEHFIDNRWKGLTRTAKHPDNNCNCH